MASIAFYACLLYRYDVFYIFYARSNVKNDVNVKFN